MAAFQHCILLVEDEVLIRFDYADCLELAGYTVVQAGNADEALSMIVVGTPKVDLLVTDVNMPGNLDGLGLAARAQELNPSLPILIVSGHMRADQSIWPVLAKPLHCDTLLERVRDVLG